MNECPQPSCGAAEERCFCRPGAHTRRREVLLRRAVDRNHALQPRPKGGLVRLGSVNRLVMGATCRRTGWWIRRTRDAHPHPGPLPEGEGIRRPLHPMRGLRCGSARPVLPVCNQRGHPCRPLPQGEGWGEGGLPPYRKRGGLAASFLSTFGREQSFPHNCPLVSPMPMKGAV